MKKAQIRSCYDIASCPTSTSVSRIVGLEALGPKDVGFDVKTYLLFFCCDFVCAQKGGRGPLVCLAQVEVADFVLGGKFSCAWLVFDPGEDWLA